LRDLQQVDLRSFLTRYYSPAARNKNNNKQKKGNMKLETLEQLYISELRDLYNAENQLLKALPKMAKAASSEELKGISTVSEAATPKAA